MLERGALDDADELASRAIGYFGMTDNQWRRLECLRVLGDIGRLRGNEKEAQLYYKAALDVAARLEARREMEMLQQRISVTAQ
jgi:hypothetical protein